MFVDPDEAGKVTEGMPVTVSVVGGPVVPAPSAPTAATSWRRPVQEGSGNAGAAPRPAVVIALDLDEAAPRGYEIDATILVSERTLLKQLLGMG